MKWLDAIEHVLREADEPLHYGELAKRIMKRQMVATQSKTPDITVHASVSQEIRRRADRGLPPRFTIKAGDIGLAEWSAPPLKDAQLTVDKLREKAKRELLKKLRQLEGADFESYLEVLLIRMGYEVEVTGGTGDDGVDLIAESSGGVSPQRLGIQAKCLGSGRETGPNPIRLLRDALPSKECQVGAVISTAKFNDDARRVAAEPGRPPVELIGPEELAELAAEHGVGISARPVDLLFEDLDGVFGKSIRDGTNEQ